MRIFKISLLLCAAILILTYTLLWALRHTSVSEQFTNFIKQEINIEISPLDLKFKIFPFPHISISKLDIPKTLIINDVNIYLSPLSILLIKPKVSKITAKTVYITSNVETVGIGKYEILINKILRNKITNNDIYIENIYLNNSQQIISNLALRWNKGSISYKLSDSEVNTFFQLNSDNTLSLNTEIIDNFYKFILKEQIDSNGFIKNGSGYLSIKDTASFFNKNFNINLLETKEQLPIPLDIKFNLADNENFLYISSIEASSSIILGSGEMLLAHDPKQKRNQVKLNLTNLNLSQFLETVNSKILFKSSPQIQFDISKLNLEMDIKVNNLVLNNENISDIKFLGATNKNTFEIQQFQGILNSGGDFALIGNIDQNYYRSLFQGTVAIKHSDANTFFKNLNLKNLSSSEKIQNLEMKSDIRITAIDYELFNMFLTIGTTNIYGKVTSRLIGSIPRITAILQINNFNPYENKIPIISSAIDYLKNFTLDTKDFSSVIPIRNISYIGNIDILFNNIIIEDTPINKVNLSLILSNNQINIKSLVINNNDIYLSTNGKLITNDLKPIIYFNVLDGNLELFNSDSVFGLEQIQKKLLFLNKKIDFNNLVLYSSINLNKVKYLDNLEINKLNFNIQNKDAVITLSPFNANIFSGNLKLDGSVSFNPMAISLGYAFNLVDLTKLVNFYPVKLQGIVSINGIMNTTGNNLNELKENLNFKGSSIGSNIFSNFNIDNFIKKINIKDYDFNNLEFDKDLIFPNKGDITSYEVDYSFQNNILTLKKGKFLTNFSSNAFSAILNFDKKDINAAVASSFYLQNQNFPQPKIVDIYTNITNTFDSPKVDININFIQKLFKK